ncbi:MAG: class I SAM-dependent methyltransferase [Sphingobacteriales bacterium]|nr:class I SAM-dependent methyltransferase [Sphingobacteriales bacterium]
MDSLQEYIDRYENTGKCNDEFHQLFTANANQVPLLKEHRDYIEKHKLGFGDRAFHFMWYLLFNDVKQEKNAVRALEIGVYKGQIISLWALLSKEMNISADISAITPLEGTVSARTLLNNRAINKIRRIFSSSFRKLEKEGNLYLNEDYYTIISNLFKHFALNFNNIHLYKGYSNAPEVLEKIKSRQFDIIYIDGDHSFEGAQSDIRNYSSLISKGGYMIMDDASWFLEGSVFWKGHEEVSRACSIIEELGFENILNIGHNRVYKKL